MALKCFENMKKLHIKPSNVTFSILAKIYQKMGQIDKSLGILDEMAKENVKPGVFVYTCMIQTCIQISKIDDALKMYKRMMSEQVKPDNVTFFTIIMGCLTLYRENEAIDLLKEALDLCGRNSNPVQFTPSQKNSLLQHIKFHLIDENNPISVSRYHDIVQVMGSLDSGAGFGFGSYDKENVFTQQLSKMNLESQPFKPRKEFVNQERSPLVDISNIPTTPDQSIFSSIDPSFSFLQPLHPFEF